MAARWYVVNVYSGSEKKVAESLKEQAVLKKMEDKILDVLVPTEEVVEIRKGSKVNAERKFFPGYILVKMEMSDECWHVVKNTPRVSGFLGSRNKPQPISDAEAERIIKQMTEGVERPQTVIDFEVGEQIRVTDGPFASFVGLNFHKLKKSNNKKFIPEVLSFRDFLCLFYRPNFLSTYFFAVCIICNTTASSILSFVNISLNFANKLSLLQYVIQ